MNYTDLKLNVSEYLRENYFEDVAKIYDDSANRDILNDATKNYLKSIEYEHDIDNTANMLLSDLFGLGVLDDILKDESITDISFNGNSLWIQSNLFGRKLYEKQISSEQAFIIIEKLAQHAQRPFNIANPILDIEYNTIRINAIHESLSPDGRSFSIRIIKTHNIISENTFPATPELRMLLQEAIKEGKNIIISGTTGSGKSELQKYLIGSIMDNEKIVLIADNNELKISKLYPQKDIYTWITNESSYSQLNIDFNSLIKPALRYNPEWLIISETRGKEAFDMINAATTGHKIITTLHAPSAFEIPTRILNMCTERNTNINEKTLLNNILQVLDYGIHMGTMFNVDGSITRKILHVVKYDKEQGITQIYPEVNHV